MSRYLDPKADIVFHKIFGQHPDLLKSFLNAVLPLPDDGLIASLEYLPSEQVPVIPILKQTVVDVKCTDQQGRVFIVEMQVSWTVNFKERMLFNASKAYVRQLEKGEHYNLLKPVYGLGLIGSQFDDNPDSWYHHYKIINTTNPEREIKDLQLIFIELPKFKAKTPSDKHLRILWLQFLSELNEHTRQVPEAWLNVPEIKKAAELSEEAAFSPGALEAYDKYWDAVSREKTLTTNSYREGEERGLQKGWEEGQAEGSLRTKRFIACNLVRKGLALEDVASSTGLPLNEIEELISVRRVD